jgi:hypothetical protein
MRSIYLILFKINFGNNTTIRVWDYYDIATNYLASRPKFSQATITATLGVCKVFCADAPDVLVGSSLFSQTALFLLVLSPIAS